MTIRAAQVEDAPELARLFVQDMRELGSPTSFEAQLELAQAVVSATQTPPLTCVCWVLVQDERVAGVILANLNWSVKFAGRALWIEALYVDPAARRGGMGRALVDHLLDWAELHGIRGVDIEAYHGNTPASILYRTMGFRRLGRERFNYKVEPEQGQPLDP